MKRNLWMLMAAGMLAACGPSGGEDSAPPPPAETEAAAAPAETPPSTTSDVIPSGSAVCDNIARIIAARNDSFASLPAGFELKPGADCSAVERDFEVGADGETVSLEAYECVYLDAPGDEAVGWDVWTQVQADAAACFDGSWQIGGEAGRINGLTTRGFLIHRRPDVPRLPFEATDLDPVRFQWVQSPAQRITFTVIAPVNTVAEE